MTCCALGGCGDNAFPEPTGTPRDLVPYARLTASATQHQSLFPWPREAEDAIATVRDDDPATAWKAPVGEEAVVAIDLQPWLGRVVPLSSLRMGFLRGAPPPMAVELLEGCGGKPHASLEWPDPTRALDLDDRRAGCVQIRVTAADELWVDQLELYSRDDTVVIPTWEPPATGLAPYANSGVIEGFYGVPWSWREREHMVATLATVGLTFYLYAPKDDPLHRDRWREPYPDEVTARFGRLAQEAAARGVTFVFGISPFIDYNGSSDADYQTLRAKLGDLAAVGVRGFAVLADDIELESTPVVDGTLGAAHVAVANRLLVDLGAAYDGVTLSFTPTVYSDERIGSWPGGADYLRALRDLDPSIPVMWTGPLTGNETLAPADLQTFVDLVGRPPLIWDNFYANDGGDGFTGHLPLGPYTGRSPDLLDAVSGIAVNASIQGALARLEVGMFGCYRSGFCPPGDPRSAAVEVELAPRAGAGAALDPDRATLRRLLEVFVGRAGETPRFPELEAALDQVTGELEASGGTRALAGAPALLQLFAEMAAFPSAVHHGDLDADLVDEFAFPLERVRADGDVGLWTMALLGERLAGRSGDEARARAQEAAARADACRFVLSPGRVKDFCQLVAALPAQAVGVAAPSSTTPTPPACRVGRQLDWPVFSGASGLQVYGLPGAWVEVASGAVRFAPPHAGSYRAIVAAESPAGGWGFVLADLWCDGP